MLLIDVLVERVEAMRISEKADEKAQPNYTLSVSMSERDRTPENLALSFTLELTNQPQLNKLSVSGVATLTGTKDEIAASLISDDDKTPPQALTMIYDKTYGLFYLVAGALKVPKPLPSLLKGASK